MSSIRRSASKRRLLCNQRRRDEEAQLGRSRQAYLDFLFTPEAQQIIAKHNFRPRDEAVLKANAAKFPALKTFKLEQHFAGWAEAQKEHFADGGVYDQITAKSN